MGELLIKYAQLDNESRQQLLSFLDFLLSKRQKTRKRKFNYSSYRERIQSLSEWSENDISNLENISDHLKEWTVKQW